MPDDDSMERRICDLKQELGWVTVACAKANERKKPGARVSLLRKRWQLLQALFEAENQLYLRRR